MTIIIYAGTKGFKTKLHPGPEGRTVRRGYSRISEVQGCPVERAAPYTSHSVMQYLWKD